MRSESRRRRRHRRVKFVYPIEFKILSLAYGSRTFKGLLSTMSLSGALYQFKDHDGLIDAKKIINLRLKLKITVPNMEQISLFARIRWARRLDSNPKRPVDFAVEFEELSDWQLELLESIISLRNKDQKMIWNLWDSYLVDNEMKRIWNRN
jgi:hypothetical protein